MSAVEACWYVSMSTDVLQEVLVNPRALDLLRETSIENGQDELQQQQQQQQQQRQQEEEEEEEVVDREHLLYIFPTRTTVWSSNNPIQV